MTSILEIWWQILVASVAYFMLGSIWFNPKVFGTAWAKSHGIVMDPEKRKEVNMGKLMGTAFLFTVMITTILAKVCLLTCGGGEACHATGIMHCVKIGVLIGGAIAAAISMTYMFLMRPANALILDGLFHVVGSVIAACVLFALGVC